MRTWVKIGELEHRMIPFCAMLERAEEDRRNGVPATQVYRHAYGYTDGESGR